MSAVDAAGQRADQSPLKSPKKFHLVPQREVCLRLGGVTVKTIERMIKDGRLPLPFKRAYGNSGQLCWDEDELNEAIAKMRVAL
jgi:predicted DNA-binding transcriptional regulator AlpA